MPWNYSAVKCLPDFGCVVEELEIGLVFPSGGFLLPFEATGVVFDPVWSTGVATFLLDDAEADSGPEAGVFNGLLDISLPVAAFTLFDLTTQFYG